MPSEASHEAFAVFREDTMTNHLRRAVVAGLAAVPLMLSGCASVREAAPKATPGMAYIASTVPRARPAPSDPANAELQATLLSWAVTLTGLPAPDVPPRLVRMPHGFFVKSACNDHECKVLGWFPPGDTVYIDDRLDPQNNLLAASIVMHEMVHYLQFRAAARGLEFSCAQSIALERQAYGAQREFITRYGVYRPVGASMHQVGCEPG
jgi:hypothetical protein